MYCSCMNSWYCLYIRKEYVPVNKLVSPTQACCLHFALILLFPLPLVSCSIFPDDSATIDHSKKKKSYMLSWNTCFFYCLSKSEFSLIFLEKKFGALRVPSKVGT